MKKISSDEARQLDKRAQEFFNIPSACLMEVAGSSSAQVILQQKDIKNVCIFCGKGNNGGDGLVIARYLINAGLKLKIYLLAEPGSLKPDPKRNFQILTKMQADIKKIDSSNDLDDSIAGADLIVDAIFGIGLTKDVEGMEKEIIEYINSLKKPVISVDVPSGLNSDTGKIMGTCVKASITVTFAVAKKGFFIGDGPILCGKIVVKDIGIPNVA